MTVPNQSPGSGDTPIEVGSGWGQDTTEETVKQWARNQVTPGFGDAYTGQFDLFKFLTQMILGGGISIPEGLNPLEFLGGMMGSKWEDMVDLQDSAQKFEGIQVYGARYMPSSMSPTTSKKVAFFNGNIHSGVGVTYSGSEIILNSRGLYKVDAQCFFSWVTLADPSCMMDIVVRAPDFSEFSRKPAISNGNYPLTVFNSHTFGVPAAGYRISVEVATGSSIVGATREILGGKGYTSLVVNKWSSEPE